MTTAVQSEATAFLYKVQQQRPDLVQLGYQKIIDATVKAMQDLGIYGDDLNQSRFWAGLQHACDSGILPKAPIPETVPAQPTAEQLAEQAEQRRLAQIGLEQEQAHNMLRSQQSNPARNGYEAAPSLIDSAKKVMNDLRETAAKREAESLQVYRPDGRVDHTKTEQLRQIYAKDKISGQVLWQKTLEARKLAASTCEQIARNKRDQF